MEFARLGIITFTTKPVEQCGFFCVLKKSGMLRLILDARRVNQRFAKPPGVALATAECLGRLEVTGPDEYSHHDPRYVSAVQDMTLTMGIGDIDNCFHRLRLPEGLSYRFCLVMVCHIWCWLV